MRAGLRRAEAAGGWPPGGGGAPAAATPAAASQPGALPSPAVVGVGRDRVVAHRRRHWSLLQGAEAEQEEVVGRKTTPLPGAPQQVLLPTVQLRPPALSSAHLSRCAAAHNWRGTTARPCAASRCLRCLRTAGRDGGRRVGDIRTAQTHAHERGCSGLPHQRPRAVQAGGMGAGERTVARRHHKQGVRQLGDCLVLELAVAGRVVALAIAEVAVADHLDLGLLQE